MLLAHLRHTNLVNLPLDALGCLKVLIQYLTRILLLALDLLADDLRQGFQDGEVVVFLIRCLIGLQAGMRL